MMTGMAMALHDFFSRFGVPAYLRDCVPTDAKLPYLTYEIAGSASFGSATVICHDWHADKPISGKTANMERMLMMDAIADAIPPGGARLDLPTGGFIALHRPETGFQMPYDDPNDTTIKGGRTSIEAHIYTI